LQATKKATKTDAATLAEFEQERRRQAARERAVGKPEMRFVADSSLLVRLYLQDSKSESIERFLADGAKVLSLSDLARVEVLNVLVRQQDRADQFLADLEDGLRLRLEPVDWPRAFQRAESLARRFSPTLRPGGHDFVLVAAAVAMGGTWFLSFDRNSRQRPLAAAAGLRV
jgi:predicted nucleic acid-binding protein